MLPIIIKQGTGTPAIREVGYANKTEHIRIYLNTKSISLSDYITSAQLRDLFEIIQAPDFGVILLGGLSVYAFSKDDVLSRTVVYQRNPDYSEDYLQDAFEMNTCNGQKTCRHFNKIIRITVDILPIEERVDFSEINFSSQSTQEVILSQHVVHCSGTLRLILRPQHGDLKVDNVALTHVDSKKLLNGQVTLTREKWTSSTDEFVLAGEHCKIIFRVLLRPLIHMKKLCIPFGRVFILTPEFLDMSQLEASTNRLFNARIFKENFTIKESLLFAFPKKTSTGIFNVGVDTNRKDNWIRFTYGDVAAGRVSFTNYPNSSVGMASEENVTIMAPNLMKLQHQFLRISIVSTQYSGQTNILLSDSGDDLNAVRHGNSPLEEPEIGVSARLKIALAAAVGLICFVVCVCVIATYFILRSWRDKRRLQTSTQYDRIVYTEPNSPSRTTNHSKAPNAMEPPEPRVSTASVLLLPLPGSDVQPVTSIFVSHSAPVILAKSESTAIWDKQGIDLPTSKPTVCFIPAEALNQLEAGSQRLACFVPTSTLNSKRNVEEDVSLHQPFCSCSNYI